MAVPFVQGRLAGRTRRAQINTACACCGEVIRFDLDSDLGYQMITPGARPLVSAPLVNFRKLMAPSIIDAF